MRRFDGFRVVAVFVFSVRLPAVAFYCGIDEIRLMSRFEFFTHRFVRVRFVSFPHEICFHRLSSFGLRAQKRNVQVAESGECERLRNRRRAHHQKMERVGRSTCNFSAFFDYRLTLQNAEAVLFVYDGELEVVVLYGFGKKRVRTDHDVDIARFKLF